MAEPRPRQERAERTRAQIIDTAAAAFAEHGYHGVSFNDLVKQSGLSKGAFYFHFASKDDLAVATFRAKQEELLARMYAEPLPSSSMEQMTFLLQRRSQLIRDDPTLLCVSRLGTELTARSAPGSVYASYHDLALGVIAGLVAEGQRTGQLRSDISPEAVARVIFGAMVGMDALSLLSSGGKDLEDRSADMTQLLLHGLAREPGRTKTSPKATNDQTNRRRRDGA